MRRRLFERIQLRCIQCNVKIAPLCLVLTRWIRRIQISFSVEVIQQKVKQPCGPFYHLPSIQDEAIELNGLASTLISGIRERDNAGRSEVDNIYDNIVKYHKATINAEHFDITLNISLG